MTQFYDAEQPIIDRLKAQIALAGVTVNFGSSAVLGGSVDIAALCPIIFVEPGDAKPNQQDEDSDDGATPEIQIWTVVLCVKALPDLSARTNTYASLGGELMRQIKDALIGWAPLGTGAVLAYAGRARPLQPVTGVMELSIDFALPAMVQAGI